MGCFIVPATEAAITTIATKVVKANEKEEEIQITLPDGSVMETTKIKLSTKLGWLNKMLWGGSALLAFEHVWHGEVSASFPFLTAIEAGETAEMLAEMSTTGVMMTAFVTAIWGGMVAVTSVMQKKSIVAHNKRRV